MWEYLLKVIMCHPWLWAKTKFREYTNRGRNYEVYMKSGNVITIDADYVTIEDEGSVKTISWRHHGCSVRRLLHLNADQVEAIVQVM